ncbi:hypothetical protein [Actinomadura verrucosospora]
MTVRQIREHARAGAECVPGDRVTVKGGSRRCSCPSASVCSPRQQHDAHYDPTPEDT